MIISEEINIRYTQMLSDLYVHSTLYNVKCTLYIPNTTVIN